jgi:hypothetical protein
MTTIIRSDEDNALEKLKDHLLRLENQQEHMKACNKIFKSKKTTQEEKVALLAPYIKSSTSILEMLKPDFCGRIGFPSYLLTNNNANIKRVKARVKELDIARGRKTKEIMIADVRCVQNAEADRLQFFFNGKPQIEILKLMKGHGFKWSPKNDCCQRLWNNNAIYSVKHFILPGLKELLLTKDI